MALSNDIREAQRILTSLQPFRYGLDRSAYKRALKRANAWKTEAESARGRGSATLKRQAKLFDAERLIFLVGDGFDEERNRLLEVLDVVGQQVFQGNPPKTSKSKPKIVQEIKVVECPIPNVARLLEDRFALSMRTLRTQLARITADVRLRAILLENISEAVICHATGAYKSAAIMAGAASEGLLMGALMSLSEARYERAFESAFPQRRHKPPAALGYDESIAIAGELGFLMSGTRHFMRGVKDLRNFVHPELELREGAYATPAAAELAIKSALLLLHDLAHSMTE